MADGDLRAFFEGAAEDGAQAVEDASQSIGGFIDHTAQNVLGSVETVEGADQASAEAIRAIGRDTGDGEPNRIAQLLNGSGEPEHSATFGHTGSLDYKKTFFDANPGTEGQVVVHHAVEQQAMRRYPGAGITPGEMHSLENLRGIPKGDINNRVHLSQLRKAWNSFYRDNPNPSKQDLLKFATELDKKYGHEFNPPIK